MLVNFISNCFMQFPTFVLGMERTSDCRRAKTLKAGENLELNGENLELLRRYLYLCLSVFSFRLIPQLFRRYGKHSCKTMALLYLLLKLPFFAQALSVSLPSAFPLLTIVVFLWHFRFCNFLLFSFDSCFQDGSDQSFIVSFPWKWRTSDGRRAIAISLGALCIFVICISAFACPSCPSLIPQLFRRYGNRSIIIIVNMMQPPPRLLQVWSYHLMHLFLSKYLLNNCFVSVSFNSVCSALPYERRFDRSAI